ncbi:MAG: hypothetical protein AAGC44_08190 [Planctomycetota bacterium]
MEEANSRSWPKIALGFLVGESLLFLGFFYFFDPRIPLRWTVALCPFAAGLWVLMRWVADPLVPDAHAEAVDLLQMTTLLSAVFATFAAGYIFLQRSGLM